MIGQTLLHYYILDELGQGGMGVVYKARDTHLDRFVALKVLPLAKVADPDRRRRFVQEAKAASALNHPNIITVHDIANENGVDFIVMEYVPGKTLDQLIPKKGLRVSEALKYAIQIADALGTAHAAGIIHRDLKPANIMVSDSGFVKVLDFGLAKLTEPSEISEFDGTQTIQMTVPMHTEEGSIVGTVSYMSPEQAEGKRVDARSDIFSFGALLHEMVTGQRMFQGESKMSTLAAILTKDPKSVTEITEGIPLDLEKIIARCVRKDPERRFQAMPDLKVALQEIKEESDSGRITGRKEEPQRRWFAWGAVLLIFLAMAAGAGWFARSKTVMPENPLTAVPLTTYPGREAEPSFSPDSGQVAFSWNGEKEDSFDIYVKLIGPGTPLRLTKDPRKDSKPAWSPDGRQIAFLRSLSPAIDEVLLIPALGGAERKLTEIAASGSLAWLPDSKWLITADRPTGDEPFSLFLLSSESGERRKLTTPPAQWWGDVRPAVSPDGRTVAFFRVVGPVLNNLHLLSLSENLQVSGEPKQLTSNHPSASSPAWTLDGREIIFSSAPFLGPSLWRIAASGSGAPQRLASVGEDGYDPAISRDGRRLAYTRQIYDTNIWRVELSGQSGKAGRPTNFISSTRLDRNPDFSPDGKRIAFDSSRSGNFEIWACDGDGSNPIQLTTFGGPHTTSPRWSPDGQNVAFDSSAEKQWEIYVISANGGTPRRITNNPATDELPTWSRDGRWLYFASTRTGEYQIWKTPANGGEAVQVTRKGGLTASESPDGKSLYYTKFGRVSGLWKIPAEGGEETQVLESVAQRAFSVVKDGIYFIPVANAGGTYTIQFFSFASGKTRSVASIEKPIDLGLTVSPDAACILYTQIDQQGSDLMLVDNFR